MRGRGRMIAVSATGAVSTFGNAQFYGSMAGTKLTAPMVGIVATASGHGYWLVAKDGGVFSFGDATFLGAQATAPVVAISH